MLVIFDLDDTLIDTSAFITPRKLSSALVAMVQAGCVLKRGGDPLARLLALDGAADGSVEALRVFAETEGIEEKFYLIGERTLRDRFPDEESVKRVEGALELIVQLRRESFLGLVSIGHPDQQRFKLEKGGIDTSLFHKILIVEGEDKKNAYESMINELGLSPSRVVVCGDRIGTDLVPAKQLGCTTIHMKRGRGGRIEAEFAGAADFTVTHPPEIVEVFEKIKKMIILNEAV